MRGGRRGERLGTTAILVSWLALVLTGSAAGQDTAGFPERCEVEAPCRVELPVYLGWRVYNAHCAACHAEDAVGSSYAPDLRRRIAGMQRREFVRALDEGYLGDRSPPRGADPEVARYYAELWAYLEARASGQLAPGPLMPHRPGG